MESELLRGILCSILVKDVVIVTLLYCGQSYKVSPSVNYYSRVVNISNLLVITTLSITHCPIEREKGGKLLLH